MSAKSRRITIRDVAHRAGVSVTTVSHVLAGRRDACSEETGRRVIKASEDLNYVPNALSRGLRRRTMDTMGFAIMDPIVEAPEANAVRGAVTFVGRFWHGAMSASHQLDQRVLLYSASLRDGAVETFLDNTIDGLLISSNSGDTRPGRLIDAGLPVVAFTRSIDLASGVGAVYADENEVVDLALRHLWDLGHRAIAHYAGPVMGRPPTSPSDIALRRRDAYLDWMSARGVANPDYVFENDSWTGEDGDRALARWLRLPTPPTAIFCANDRIASDMLRWARARDMRVPADLSIVGIDNCGHSVRGEDALTTIDIPVERLGEESVRMLHDAIRNGMDRLSQRCLSGSRLVVRSSSGLAPSAYR